MSDFHIGDMVYIRTVGTISTVSGLTLSQDIAGTVGIAGYEMKDLPMSFPSDQLELVAAGRIREAVGAHLSKRRAA